MAIDQVPAVGSNGPRLRVHHVLAPGSCTIPEHVQNRQSLVLQLAYDPPKQPRWGSRDEDTDVELTHEWDDSTVAALKKALDEGLDQYHTAVRMIGLLGPEPQVHAACVVRALQYHPMSRPQLKDPGSRIYAPMVEMDGTSHPEPVGEATDDTLSAWADALELLAVYPLAVSRLADLLWLRRFGPKPYLYAEAAQRALRALWTYPGIAEVYRADCLTRALDITAEAGMKTQAADTVGEVTSAATQVLANAGPMPGPCLRLLTRLASLPTKQRPPELAGLLEAYS